MNQLTLTELNIKPAVAFAIINANVEQLQEDGLLGCAVFLAQHFSKYAAEYYEPYNESDITTLLLNAA